MVLQMERTTSQKWRPVSIMACIWTAVIPLMLAISTAMTVMISADENLCNYIQEKDSGAKGEIYVLDCQRLHLTEIPLFKSRRKVDKLLLGENQITKVPDDAFKHISPSVIDLHANTITSMGPNAFRGLESKLKDLNISVNPIPFTNITAVFKLGALETFDLHDTNLRVRLSLHKAAFRGLGKLKQLVLGGNGIKSLNRTFQGLNELRFLDLQNNKLNSLGHSLGGLKKLETLDVSTNNLKHFPKDELKDLSRLSDLSVHHNRIRKIQDDAFAKVSQLRRLCISENPIKTLENLNVPAFKNIRGTLKHLDLRKITLPSAPVDLFKELNKLESLDISSTKLKQLPDGAFASLKSLQILKIGSNQLQLSPGSLSGLEGSLRELYVQDMKMKNIPSDVLKKLSKLEKLVASSNNIQKISTNCLAGVGAWKYIFDKNAIKEIAPTAFESATKPVELDLYENKLPSLDFVKDGCRFSYIDVSENPITCGCSVRELIRHADLEIVGTCASPAGYRNLDISSPEFREKTDQSCNLTKTELVYCNLLEEGAQTGGSPGGTMSKELYWSLLISILIQCIGLWIQKL